MSSARSLYKNYKNALAVQSMQGELDFWIGIFLLDINTDFSLLGRFVFAALQEGMHGLLEDYSVGFIVPEK